MKKISMFFVLFSMLFFVVACTSNKTNKEMVISDNYALAKESSNNLISNYETIQLENAIESSIRKKVFKKKGYPDGYDLTISRAKKEVNLVIRPYSKKNFNYLKDDLKSTIEEVLKANNYTDYKANVLADWSKTNQTERQENEEKIVYDIVKIMGNKYKIEVITQIGFSATDGHIVQLLFMIRNNKEIIYPIDVNNFHKEFLKLAKEKGVNVSDIPILFKSNIKRDWEMKVMPSINQGLKEIKDLKVISTTIIDDQSPIFINTAINSTDKNAKKIGKRIEKLINEFFQYNDINKSFPGPHEIQVLSKDNKKIN
ncbi:hypothetical protein [Rummeliibacillus pycnus]|uniref:hypothetical protein n=1 Tax=Rummeliibacillus pycnus TaxID=101070 RepID=UPI003D26E4D4